MKVEDILVTMFGLRVKIWNQDFYPFDRDIEQHLFINICIVLHSAFYLLTYLSFCLFLIYLLFIYSSLIYLYT
jgi:hypothetical protein